MFTQSRSVRKQSTSIWTETRTQIALLTTLFTRFLSFLPAERPTHPSFTSRIFKSNGTLRMTLRIAPLEFKLEVKLICHWLAKLGVTANPSTCTVQVCVGPQFRFQVFQLSSRWTTRLEMDCLRQLWSLTTVWKEFALQNTSY